MKVKLNGNDWYRLTADFGDVSHIHPNGHTGIDLAMPEGTELYSPVDGVVKNIVDYGDKNLGKGIFIETNDNQTVIMGHLSDFKVKVGDVVKEDQIVALSGNTGHSTGAHLHLGMKDESGNFINPDELIVTDLPQSSVAGISLNGIKEGFIGIKDGWSDFWDFINTWGEKGFFYAVYGKSFFEVMKDFFKDLFRDIGIFILKNGDIFFLAPAILFMFGTFLVGRNKFTKWILPLWFFYFLSTFFYKMMIQ